MKVNEPKMPERCSYPDCNCPFDHPGTKGWCARGLPATKRAQAPTMPKKQGTATDMNGQKEAIYGQAVMERHHAAWQAYAAGIRAAVLAEVRAVVPGIRAARTRDEYDEGFADGHNACRERIDDALTTLEQQP